MPGNFRKKRAGNIQVKLYLAVRYPQSLKDPVYPTPGYPVRVRISYPETRPHFTTNSVTRITSRSSVRIEAAMRLEHPSSVQVFDSRQVSAMQRDSRLPLHTR